MRKASVFAFLLLSLLPVLGPSQTPDIGFSFCRPLHPEILRQYTVAALVVPVEPIQMEAMPSQALGEEPMERKVQTFKVRVIEGTGLARGGIYPCLASGEAEARPSPGRRFLLLGWSSKGSKRIATEPETQMDRIGKISSPPMVAVKEETLYVGVFVPTTQERPAKGTEPAATAILNLAEALRNATPTSLRQITSWLAILPDHYMGTRIEGIDPVQWLRQTLGEAIGRLPQTTPAERFRLGGLLAAWNRPKYALAYLKSLPELMTTLDIVEDARVGTRSPTQAQWERRDDQFFLGPPMDLVTGLDPDAILEFAFRTPLLKDIVLSPNLGKPSLENQRKMMTYFHDPVPERRASALSHFVRWYATWDKRAYARWSDQAGGVIVERESELIDYWTKRIGEPIKP